MPVLTAHWCSAPHAVFSHSLPSLEAAYNFQNNQEASTLFSLKGSHTLSPNSISLILGRFVIWGGGDRSLLLLLFCLLWCSFPGCSDADLDSEENQKFFLDLGGFVCTTAAMVVSSPFLWLQVLSLPQTWSLESLVQTSPRTQTCVFGDPLNVSLFLDD